MSPNAETTGRPTCKQFLHGQCRQANCTYIHDEVLRKQTMEQKRTQFQGGKADTIKFNPSMKLCQTYTSGGYCRLQNRASGCRFVHDLQVRREFLAKKVENEKASSTAGSTEIVQQDNKPFIAIVSTATCSCPLLRRTLLTMHPFLGKQVKNEKATSTATSTEVVKQDTEPSIATVNTATC